MTKKYIFTFAALFCCFLFSLPVAAQVTSFLVPENGASGFLDSGITDSALSLTLQSGEGANFPSTFNYHVVIGNVEIVRVTNRSSDVLTIVRAQEGTSAVAHLVNSTVDLNVTAEYISELSAAINNIEDGTTVLDIKDLLISDTDTPTITITDTTTPVTMTIFSNDSSGTIGTTTNHPFLINVNGTLEGTWSTTGLTIVDSVFVDDVVPINTTASLMDTVATTLNIGGVATTVNIGAATGTINILNPNLITANNFFAGTDTPLSGAFSGSVGGIKILPGRNFAEIIVEGTISAGIQLIDQTAGVDNKHLFIRNRDDKTVFQTLDDALSAVEELFITLDHATGLVVIDDDIRITGNDVLGSSGNAVISFDGSDNAYTPNGFFGVGRIPTVDLDVYNNAGTTDTTILLEQANVSTLFDAIARFKTTDFEWTIGLNNDSNNFEINSGSALNALPEFVIDSSLNASFPNSGTTTFGTLDSVRAIFNMHGNATTSGPFIQLNNAGGEDTDTDTWVISANDNLEINNDSGTTLLLDGATNNVDIPNGLLNSGIAYAELYQDSASPGHTITIAVQNTWYKIDNFLPGEETSDYCDADATTDGITVSAAGAGVYICTWICSFSGGSSKFYELGLSIDGANPDDSTHVQRKMGTGGDLGNAGGIAILTLAGTELLTLEIRGIDATTADAEIWSSNLSISRLSD